MGVRSSALSMIVTGNLLVALGPAEPVVGAEGPSGLEWPSPGRPVSAGAMSSPAWAAECLEIPGDDRCEAWVAERAYGDIWGGFLQEQAARNLVALDDLLLVAEPVNDPGAQRFEERYDFELAAFATADGSVRWTRRYGGPDGAWDIPYSVALSPDERVVYVTGMRDYPRTPNIIDIGGGCTEEFHPASAITLAYTVADGALLWASGLDEEPSLDATFGSALSPGGETLYVAGARAGSSDEECDIDFAVAALDTATGREIWRTVLPGAPGRFDQAMTVVVTPDGATLVATGVTSTANRGADYLTIGLDLPDQGEPPAVVSLDW